MSLHEEISPMKVETIERHRAIVSLTEELEAVDWYDQRVDATQDEELRSILKHNRNEEKEHAAMLLEWLRRRDPEFDLHLKTYLFSEGPATSFKEDDREAESEESQSGSLQIGSLCGEESL